MNYELVKKLKDAGFPHTCNTYCRDGYYGDEVCCSSEHTMERDKICVPTLSELIEACGEKFMGLVKFEKGFKASGFDKKSDHPVHVKDGDTPEEAVATLWLALNEK